MKGMKRILTVLGGGEAMTISEIGLRCRLSERTVRARLADLERTGRVDTKLTSDLTPSWRLVPVDRSKTTLVKSRRDRAPIAESAPPAPRRSGAADQVWTALRDAGAPIARRDLPEMTGCSGGSVETYLSALARSGFVKLDGPLGAVTARQIRDTGPAAPRPGARVVDGKIVRGVEDPNTGEFHRFTRCRAAPRPVPRVGPRDAIDRAWAAARVLRRGFDVETLALCAKVEASEVRTYLKLLVRAGYVAPDRAAGRMPGDTARLRRDTGPVAPRRVITGLLDRNTGEVFPLAPVASEPEPEAPAERLARG